MLLNTLCLLGIQRFYTGPLQALLYALSRPLQSDSLNVRNLSAQGFPFLLTKWQNEAIPHCPHLGFLAVHT
jgi:hypothetical protein